MSGLLLWRIILTMIVIATIMISIVLIRRYRQLRRVVDAHLRALELSNRDGGPDDGGGRRRLRSVAVLVGLVTSAAGWLWSRARAHPAAAVSLVTGAVGLSALVIAAPPAEHGGMPPPSRPPTVRVPPPSPPGLMPPTVTITTGRPSVRADPAAPAGPTTATSMPAAPSSTTSTLTTTTATTGRTCRVELYVEPAGRLICVVLPGRPPRA